MINKIYEKVINYIKENYGYLIVLVLIIFLGFYHLPYNLYVGGGTINLKNRLEVENEYSEKGSFNLSYVTSYHATIPSYLLSYVFGWERENINDTKLDENDSVEDIWEREKLYLQEANDNAILSAYDAAQTNYQIKKEVLKILYVDKDSETDLKIGDTILMVDNVEIKELSDLKNILNKYDVGDTISVKYLRNNEEKNGYIKVRLLDKEKKAGLYLIKLYEYELSRKVNLKFSSNEGGPSGGLMTSLAIYNRLTKDDITKGRKIVGTGTIDRNGNVGEIGGVKYKIAGAVKGKCDVFFVPEGNYEEAMKVKKEKGYDINIVMVKTLDDAINYLMR